MKFLSIIIISVSFSVSAFSQIQRIQSGSYKFAKGEISLTLVDTVSKEYAELEIVKRGYEIISSDIHPITFMFSKEKDKLELARLEKNPLIESIIIEPSMFDSVAVEEMIIRQKMNEEQAERSRKSFESMRETAFVRIIMKFYVTEEMALKFYEDNKEFNLRPPRIIPRSVTVKTVPGKENEAMKELKKLKIVESAAYIALIGEQ